MGSCTETGGAPLAHTARFRGDLRSRDHRARQATPAPTLSIGSVVARSVRLIGGLALFATGLALMLRADLGLSAWDVLHDALRALTPLTFGQVVVATSVVVLVASVALGVKPGIGTIANSILIGVFTDALLQTPLLQDLPSGDLTPRLAAMLAGIWGIALGSALYISAKLGAGPRDALMLGVAQRSRHSAGAARTAIEVSVLVIGIALGGSAGFGTAAFVILIGPAINVSFRLVGLEPPRDKSQAGALARALNSAARWGRRGELGAAPSQTDSRATGGRV